MEKCVHCTIDNKKKTRKKDPVLLPSEIEYILRSNSFHRLAAVSALRKRDRETDRQTGRQRERGERRGEREKEREEETETDRQR